MAVAKWQHLYEKYEEFVKRSPNLASELESILRWVSYLTAGRFENSGVVSELIFALSSLLKLFNDLILRQAANLPVHISAAVAQLKTFLAVIEYSEVFAELAASKFGGDFSRWTIITIIQIIKSAIRLLLLIKHKQGIIKSPPISPLNRKKDLLPSIQTNGDIELNSSAVRQAEALHLKRSGRTVRTLEAAPPLARRNWKLPSLKNEKKNDKTHSKVYFPPTTLEGQKFIGEVLHVMRPVLHLAALGIFGDKSWKPWLTAIGCDMTSLQLLGDRGALNHNEQLELSRRALVLLMYVLRSPLYDRFTKTRILSVLLFLSKKVPIAGILFKQIADYIPDWQRTYFHAWSM